MSSRGLSSFVETELRLLGGRLGLGRFRGGRRSAAARNARAGRLGLGLLAHALANMSDKLAKKRVWVEFSRG